MTLLITCIARLSFPGQGYDDDFKVGFSDPINDYGDAYPGGIPSYEQADNKKVVVTYSSINGNGYGGYGEVVMGSKGTLVLDKEAEVSAVLEKRSRLESWRKEKR